MKLPIDVAEFRHTGTKKFKIDKAPTSLSKKLYKDSADLNLKLQKAREEIDELQQKMYAHDRYGLQVIFQAMDAAGKDGTIRHVMSGINPGGVEIHNFKRPSDDELDHDYLWRCQKVACPRGRIGIFNRSYYEEVLVCRVHPEIVTKYQRLPAASTRDMKSLYASRLRDISRYEEYLHGNGIRVVKFFLHVSKEEQKNRFLDRIREPSKNWKFNSADVKERGFWDDYMSAYEKAINGTASKLCPWYAIPADDKGAMRLLVSAAILHELGQLDLKWPQLPPEQKADLAEAEKLLLAEK
jgi:PPK2 family polyphosphate:nucleotide phosphotransferase